MTDRAPMNTDLLVAIDVHVHLEHAGELTASDVQAQKYFGASAAARDWNVLADYYRSRKMGCVVFPVDEKLTGRPRVPNEQVAEFAARNADIAIAFASIDPTRGAEAVARGAASRGGRRHPRPEAASAASTVRAQRPPRLPALRGLCRSAAARALSHRTQRDRHRHAGRRRHSSEVRQPDARSTMWRWIFRTCRSSWRIPSFPWQDEAISVCLHKPQVYIDLSGWSPKYFSPTLVQYANTLLKHKVLFGSDYPLLTPDRWLADFEKIAIRDEVRPLILKDNAVRLFGL